MKTRTVTGRDPATGDGIAVEIEDGRIAALRPAGGRDGPYLACGLVDLQVNGFAGIDLNDGALVPERVAALTARLHEEGVTTFLPTLITASEEAIIAGLAAIAEARDADPAVARSVPFVHVEGPFLSPEDGPRGAHPADRIRPPDLAEFERWQRAGGLVGMITLSPHGPEAPDFIRAVSRQGVHVAIGHTGATPHEIRAAVEAGARLSTHLGNGAAAMLPRHPNFIWSQLAEDRLVATFIADGHHLPADTFKAMLRAKGLPRSVLVSDSAALGGMPPGIYKQKVGGRVEVTADGRLSMAGTPYLAGAARPLRDGVAGAVAMADISLAQALSLASANPGRFAGGCGAMRIGAPADLIRFCWQEGDRTLKMESVFVRGRELA